VCAAVGRATNTDPVLWRVLLVVLGFFGGVGILVYLAAWLLIPAEGDTASPVESMFGKGRSNTSPILVIVLAVLVALMFGFIVTDGFRAALLGAAVLIGGALLLNRTNNPPTTTAPPAGPPPGPAYPRFGGVTGDVPPPAQGAPFPPGPIPAAPAGPSAEGPSYPLAPPPYPGAAPPGHPAGMPSGGAPPGSGAVPAVGPTDSTITEPLPPMPPAPGQPAGGYRPPFAPHGPYGGAPPPPPPPPPRPPRPPRERSPLGAATLSMVLVALGLVTALDVANVLNPRPSAYFAAALATVALGLLVGAWFGRARWLIALGLVFAAALGISTIAESEDVEGRIRSRGGPVVWTPTGLTELEPRYEHSFGQATLDLTTVDFTDREAEVNVAINAGDLDVILPETVDTTVMLRVRAGDATVFGENYGGVNVGVNRIQDDGTDGPGGGRLVLNLEVNAGDAEVHR
jgi:phage shock protein PspC (stress-responsive transcriptional regulator)